MAHQESTSLSSEGDKEQRRRKLLMLALLILLLLLASVCGLFYRYIRRPAPLPELVVPQGVDYPPHYLFSIYGVERPVGVALSPGQDRLYVAESGGERLVKSFETDGTPIASFAAPGTSPGERAPVYMATDSLGRLYVSDRLQHAIIVFDQNGGYLDTLIAPDLSLSEYVDQHVGGLLPDTTFSFNLLQASVLYRNPGTVEQTLPAPPVSAAWAPLGVRIGTDDRMYVTDVTESRNAIREYTLPAEATLISWHDVNLSPLVYGRTGQGNGEFLYPNSAVADSQGRVYVSDGNNGRISVWDGQGNFLFHFGSGSGEGALSLPRGIYIDHRDRLFVVDAVGQNVKVYDVFAPEPAFLYAFGDLGIDDGLFSYPNDIAVDEHGRLYIADRENNRVQVWSY
ncbi:MAG: hypothetical protein ACE5E7_15200 [Anaerolineae bacterium]